MLENDINLKFSYSSTGAKFLQHCSGSVSFSCHDPVVNLGIFI
jgi:hypothetical protein